MRTSHSTNSPATSPLAQSRKLRGNAPLNKAAAAALSLAIAAHATSAFAGETDPPPAIDVSGSVTAVSDYRLSGISQTGGAPALQAGVTAAHKSGFYAGAWGSTLHDRPTLGGAEVNLTGGWSGEVASGVTLDAGMRYYYYPGGTGATDYAEPYASVKATLGPVDAKAGVHYAWKQRALGNDSNVYYYGELNTAIPSTKLSLNSHLGYTHGAASPWILTGGTKRGGFDYSVGASYQFTPSLAAGVSYVGVDGRSIKGLSTDTAVGSVTFSF